MILVVSTAPDLKTARRIARVLVDGMLAACVSVVPGLESRYRWKGRLETAKEVLVLIKAPKKNYSKIEAALIKAHPYDLPEIVSIPVAKGSKRYLNWIENLGL